MKKINVLQFTPYFPPHKGGLETVAEEFSKYFVQQGCEVINITSSIGQKSVGFYSKNGYKIIIIPSFDIIPNFPIPKFRTRKFRNIMKIIKKRKPDIIQTHTRFFLSTFLGGIISKFLKIKRVHIEHGSEYVQVSAGWKNKVAYFYDRIIGKRVFKKADFIIAISNDCKYFIEKKFLKRISMQVVYRGLEIPLDLPVVEDLKKKFPGKYIVGFIGRLYKWKNVESMINAYYSLDGNLRDKFQLVIVGDGEDFTSLQNLDTEKYIYFTGGKSFEEALAYQKQFDIHYHTSNPGGGLATTLLQAMYFGCLIVATPNEGALDVLENNRNAIVLKNSSLEEIKKGIVLSLKEYKNKEKWAKLNKEIINKKFKRLNNIKEYIYIYKKIIGRI